jgi:hypothetical protein
MTHTRSRSSRNTGRRLPVTETFASFLAANGGAESARRGTLMLSAEGSPARTSATRGGAKASMVRGPGSGASLPGSFAYFDRATCLWRTYQPSLFEDWSESSVNWPNSGLMLSGIAYPQRRLVPRIDDGGCLSLPTPKVTNRTSRKALTKRTDGKGGTASLSLEQAIEVMNGILPKELVNYEELPEKYKKMFPTPSATDGTRSGTITENMSGTSLPQFINTFLPTPRASENCDYQRDRGQKGKERLTLSGVVKQLYPTPRADGRDNAGGTNSRRTAKANGTYFGRTLNPQFVEWLMGFPIGWTDLEDSATPSSPK